MQQQALEVLMLRCALVDQLLTLPERGSPALADAGWKGALAARAILGLAVGFVLAAGLLRPALARRPGGQAHRLDRLALLLLGLVPVLSLAALLDPGLALPHVDRLISLPLAAEPHALGLSIYLDRLSLTMLLVIGLIGLVVYRYALRYLLGDPRQPRFLAWLSVTVAASELLVVSGNLVMFGLCWLLVSVGLHELLQHHRERERAVMAARKKFLISRLGDLSLAGAMAVILSRFGTLDLTALFERAGRGLSDADASALSLAGVGISMAAICKSAQFPFHSWLPDTLEAPTPVSALMHAGIVNAGGFLLIRFSPLLKSAPAALSLLAIVGAATAALGTLAMWAQTDVKRSLAWSTVGQMGFMMLECGLGAFSAALMHLIGHGFYKAHAFLRSGTLEDAIAAPGDPEPPTPGEALRGLALGLLAALATLSAMFALVGVDPAHAPGGRLLPFVLALALAQMLVPTAEARRVPTPLRLALLVGVAACAALLIKGFEGFVGASIAEVPGLADRGSLGAALAVLIAALCAAMAVLSALLPWLVHRGMALGLYVHSVNGFYLGTLTDRLVRRIWPARELPRV